MNNQQASLLAALCVLYTCALMPNVQGANTPWHLQRITQRGALSRQQIQSGAPAFNLSAIPQNPVNVYVLDSGISATHAEFAGGRAVLGPNIRDPRKNSTDCNGHGTHVAALAVGSHSGVASKARAISVKVLDCDGRGSCADILSGMEWVARDSLRRRRRGERSVLVMSVGSTSGACAATLEAARRLWRSGVVVAAAAGNRNADACELFPAKSVHTITVGAVDIEDRSYAKNNLGACVDIFAPGVDIVSAGSLVSNTEMEMKSGTSMATPLVGGAAALILGARGKMSADEVKEILISSSTKNKVLERDGKTMMSAAKNRLLYAPWARLFADIKMNGKVRANGAHSQVIPSSNHRTGGNSSLMLMSVSLTLTPSVTPAMAYSTILIKRSLARQTDVAEDTIVARRDEGATLLSNGSEPDRVPLVFYIPTDTKLANSSAARIMQTVASGWLRASSLENVTIAAGEGAVRLNVTLPEIAGEASSGAEDRASDGQGSKSKLITRTLLVVGVFSGLVFVAVSAHFVARRRTPSRNWPDREGDVGPTTSEMMWNNRRVDV